VLGTVESPDGRQLTVADVPGLLEGASQGIGLGDEFLAHLERARLLLHVIEANEDVEQRFRAIDRELAAYGAGLAERPQIVVLNKADLLAEPPSVQLDDPRVLEIVATSAVTGAGIDELKRVLFERIPERKLDEPPPEAELADFLVYRPRPRGRRRPFRILRTDEGYRVAGAASEEEAREALRAAGLPPQELVAE
jgi:GTP-binding protein